MPSNRQEFGSAESAVDKHLEDRAKLNEARSRLLRAEGKVSKFFASRAVDKAVRSFEASAEHVGMVDAVRNYPFPSRALDEAPDATPPSTGDYETTSRIDAAAGSEVLGDLGFDSAVQFDNFSESE